MILKMKLVNLAGDRGDIDKVIEQYLIGREIEFENPLSVFKNAQGFTPHTEANPYAKILKRFCEVFDYAGISYDGIKPQKGSFSLEDLKNTTEKFDNQLHSLKSRIKELEAESSRLSKIIQSIEPVLNSEIRLESLKELEFLRFKFGRMPTESFLVLEKYLGDLPAYFADIHSDSGYVWGFFFTPSENFVRVDHIFSSLYFESFQLDTKFSGTPKEICTKLHLKQNEIANEINAISDKMKRLLKIQKKDLLSSYASVKYYFELNNIKKNAVYTKHSFYFTFWANSRLANALLKETESFESIKLVTEEPSSIGEITVPTQLKNNFFAQPFEDFVKMYGTPKYNELDPTSFLAFMYTLLFGMMFGDLGHGAVLLILGIILTALNKGGFIAKIFIPVGISSSVFGILYGTFFGLEGEKSPIKPLWFTPMEDKTRILFTTVIIGVLIIVFCMVLNIINGFKQKNLKKIFFSQNGLAGLLFYTLTLFTVSSLIFKSKNPAFTTVLIAIISLVAIFLQEPLSNFFEKRKTILKSKEKKNGGGFLVESFFELFEIILSFVTNSMSFVRVGAFALNHAGMMSVVIMFAENSGNSSSLAVTILGNALVIGLEGLIVGIQVLRLGFYEMFSRFYEGGGRPFKSSSS